MKVLVDDFGRYFNKYGITKEILKDQYEKNQSVGDFAWLILQKILSEIANSYETGNISLLDFYGKSGETYRQMAYLLKLEKKDSRKIQSLQFENEIKHMELAYADLIGVKIFSYGCCDGCQPYHDKILTLEEALDFAKSTVMRCQPRLDKNSRCVLFPEVKEDENSPIKFTVTVGD